MKLNGAGDFDHVHARPMTAAVLRFARTGSLLAGWALSGSVAAQSPPAAVPSDPSAPHERLRFFEGTWTTAESTPEEAFRERCSWLPEGRRHMVCLSRWKSRAGPREGMSVFSFDAKSGKYLYTGFRAGGGVVVLHGEEREGRWHFASEEGSGPTRLRNRVTIAANPGGFEFRGERSVGDGPWSPVSRVLYLRVAE